MHRYLQPRIALLAMANRANNDNSWSAAALGTDLSTLLLLLVPARGGVHLTGALSDSWDGPQ